MPSRLPIAACEFLFSGQPVVDIPSIPPAACYVEAVREPGDLVARRKLGVTGVLRQHPLAREDCCDIGGHHGSLLIIGSSTESSFARSDEPLTGHGRVL